ncbi:uncharacterized protein LOC110988896 [Acanthaster planci]|uniref:Uncharacterized protein LOC110988896 n=1 Tax=Acanthaster planci TaxID=133434 RepID=A0A8B7ZUS8_ACAPL|nr:uncharacterized protein LOC110988896 [Acanthaster planci]XP_022108533.1 uncharacterized protein LOC110988896 [Acanthaster planci]XP_022108534.1 uncharacterized protein LOC110988896 [Acanthaster planci]XP_022108535.1 uncharacterized protein LOC110988896 [Acanthaster planci]XP_022108536.1 uncharacterized protein LOC110988896 [Acanthaster planci]XP_022108537.1 uncharacterized protein LOC110988896 [Acanthaster planci]
MTMKSKRKTKNLDKDCSLEASTCNYKNSNNSKMNIEIPGKNGSQETGCCRKKGSRDQDEPSTTREGLRRSSRKRSAPHTFATMARESKGIHWSSEEKEKLLRVLQELNTKQFAAASYKRTNRYPYKMIRRRVVTKSMEDVKKYLTVLERRAAGMALSQMKHQPPLESWRQMADKLTVLTSDNCSRHLIRVCNTMALESKDVDKEMAEEENDAIEEVDIPALSNAPSTLSSFAATSVTATVSPFLSVTSSTTPLSVATSNDSAVRSTTCNGQSTENSEVITSSESPHFLVSSDKIVTTMSSETEPHSGMTSTMSNDTNYATRTPATTTKSSGSVAATKINSNKTSMPSELNFKPDYEAIYKYIASLMQGERKELGPLESLVVLDCLSTVEKHLIGRDNTAQKRFAQKRFLDILENLYLTIDHENTEKTGNGDINTAETVNPDDDMEVVTIADLVGDENQLSTAHSSKRARPLPVRLGSLNPFSIPTRLLEIRRDR